MDVCSYDEDGAVALDAAVQAAGLLPADGWLGRVVEGVPLGPLEGLFAAVRGTAVQRQEREEALRRVAHPDRLLVVA